MKPISAIIILVLAVAGNTSAAVLRSEASPADIPELEKRIRQTLESTKTAGAAIAIVNRDTVSSCGVLPGIDSRPSCGSQRQGEKSMALFDGMFSFVVPRLGISRISQLHWDQVMAFVGCPKGKDFFCTKT